MGNDWRMVRRKEKKGKKEGGRDEGKEGGSKKTSPTGQRCVLTVSLRGAKFALIVLDRWMNRLNR